MVGGKMWIANKEQKIFVNIETGALILVGHTKVRFWEANNTNSPRTLVQVKDASDAEAKYNAIKEALLARHLLLLEFEK